MYDISENDYTMNVTKSGDNYILELAGKTGGKFEGMTLKTGSNSIKVQINANSGVVSSASGAGEAEPE